MLGKIFIKDLLVRCHIGINDEEKKNAQDILINVELTTNVNKAITSDDLNKTVDYKPIYEYILELSHTSRFNLIETLANNIAIHSLDFNPCVQYVTVRVEKPYRFSFLKSVGVEISHTHKKIN